METKFTIACCIFAFITGMYLTVMINQERGCRIEVTKGQVTHVYIGRAE